MEPAVPAVKAVVEPAAVETGRVPEPAGEPAASEASATREPGAAPSADEPAGAPAESARVTAEAAAVTAESAAMTAESAAMTAEAAAVTAPHRRRRDRRGEEERGEQRQPPHEISLVPARSAVKMGAALRARRVFGTTSAMRATPLRVILTISAAALAFACGRADPFAIVHVADVVAMERSGAVTVLDANKPDFREREGIVPGAVLLSSYAGYDVEKELPSGKDARLVFYCADSH